jgi:hypothetical protein
LARRTQGGQPHFSVRKRTWLKPVDNLFHPQMNADPDLLKYRDLACFICENLRDLRINKPLGP